MTTRHFRSLLLLFALAATVAVESSSKECVYTLYVKTGTIVKAGTDSIISVTLGDSNGEHVSIPNLKEWGLMGENHDYFERESLDIFSGRGRCLKFPVCRLEVTSDGSGSHPGWFVDYVEVTATGPHLGCSQTVFYLNQWLSYDAPPHELTAILDGCDLVSPRLGEKRPFVVGKPVGSASE